MNANNSTKDIIYKIDKDTLRIQEDDQSPYYKGSIIKIGKDGTEKIVASEYSGYSTRNSSFYAAIQNIRIGKVLGTPTKKLLMTMAIYTAMEKKGIRAVFASSNLTNISYTPVNGFHGMYVYFKLGINDDMISLRKFVVDHNIEENWERGCDKYETMAKQIKGLPTLLKSMNREYSKLKKLANVAMEKN